MSFDFCGRKPREGTSNSLFSTAFKIHEHNLFCFRGHTGNLGSGYHMLLVWHISSIKTSMKIHVVTWWLVQLVQRLKSAHIKATWPNSCLFQPGNLGQGTPNEGFSLISRISKPTVKSFLFVMTWIFVKCYSERWHGGSFFHVAGWLWKSWGKGDHYSIEKGFLKSQPLNRWMLKNENNALF